MKLQVIIILVLITKLHPTAAENFHLEIAADENRWKNLCNYLTKVMLNNEAMRKGFVDVTVVLTENEKENFGNFFSCLVGTSDQIVLNTVSDQMFARKPDFAILLMHDVDIRKIGENARTDFNEIFPDKAVKVFLIVEKTINDDLSVTNVEDLNFFMAISGFFNNLFITNYKGSLNVSRMNLKNGFGMQKISQKNLDFPPSKMGEIHSKIISLYQVNSPPLSVIKDGKLFGVEGKFIDEFCKRNGISYKIVNKEVNLTSMFSFYDSFDDAAELTLNDPRTVIHDTYVKIPLGHLDGSCMLAPKNIVSSKNLEAPFDVVTTYLIITTVALIVFLWKMFSLYTRSNFKMSFILINIFKCTIGQNVDEEHRLTRKEKLLIYSYILGSMIFVSLYQSALVALMLAEPTFRSVQSFKELNDSSTKIFQFYSWFKLNNDDLKYGFRDEVILHKVDPIRDQIQMALPDNFDPNLAYLVRCSYADAFLKSTRNFKADQQIFDKIPERFSISPQEYFMKSYFPLIKEMRQMVSSLRESGIRNHWIDEAFEDKSSDLKMKRVTEVANNFLEFKNMLAPFVVLSVGLSLAFISFIVEKIIHVIAYLNRVTYLP